MSGKLSQNSLHRQRQALLAKVHMAANALGLIDKSAKDDKGRPNDDYHFILRDEFGVASSAALSNRELEQLVVRFEARGWKPKTQKAKKLEKAQADALKEKIGQKLIYSDFDDTRLRGLVREICGVDNLQWCGDSVRLKRLLAAIGNMIKRGDIKVIPPGAAERS